jgi:hypothetical protein
MGRFHGPFRRPGGRFRAGPSHGGRMRSRGKREAAPAVSPASQAGSPVRQPVSRRTAAPSRYGRGDEEDDWDGSRE